MKTLAIATILSFTVSAVSTSAFAGGSKGTPPQQSSNKSVSLNGGSKGTPPGANLIVINGGSKGTPPSSLGDVLNGGSKGTPPSSYEDVLNGGSKGTPPQTNAMAQDSGTFSLSAIFSKYFSF